jgi:hypothetical protein
MKTPFPLRFVLCSLLLALCSGILASPAFAYTVEISAKNDTAVEVFDVHVVISGTGGSIHAFESVNPIPQAFDAGDGNEVNAAWEPGLPVGDTWVARFDVDDEHPFAQLAVAFSNWTDKDHNVIPEGITGGVTLQQFVFVPEPGIAVFLMAGASGLLATRRLRRRA